MSNSEPLREVVRETDWALTDASGHVHLPVLDGRRATGDYLQMSGDVFIPAEEGLLEQVLGQLAGHKSLGVRRSERVLAQGAVITAIGELATAMDHPGMFKGAFRAPGKVFVLQAPRKGPFMLSRRRLPEIVASAQATSIYCTQMATFFTVAGATMLLAVGVRKVWLWHREQTMKRRVDEARRRRRTTAGGGGRSTSSTGAGMEVGHEEDREGDQGGDARSGTCVVCLERESELVYPQCGHLCVCSLCGGAGPGLGRCPICRSRGPPIKVFRT